MSSSRVSRPAVAVAGVFVLLSALVLVAADTMGTQASHAGGMDAMSIDFDVTGNSATALGPRDSCVEAGTGDVVVFDVTALNIPESNPMLAFSYLLAYDDSRFSIESQDHGFLLAATPGSSVMSLGQPTPDSDLSGGWTGAAADLSNVPREFGSGVLSRLAISLGPEVVDGFHAITLADAGHVDPMNDIFPPDVMNSGTIAVGVPCPASTPDPSPAPTTPGTPQPTPTPRITKVSIEGEVWVSLRNNTVTLRGTATCPASTMITVEAAVQQFVKGATVVASGGDGSPLVCYGETPWSLSFAGLGGRFRPGPADAVVIAHAEGLVYGASGPVYLKPGAAK